MEDGASAMAWYDSFRGQVVVVTGASSGIGRATALAFAAAGARVVLIARRRDMLDDVAHLARESGAEVLVVPADVTERGQVQAAFAAVDDRFGRTDVVVNNAGILLPATVLELDPSDLDRMLRVNLFGALFVMQESVRRMRARKRGCVVNVASLAGRRGVSPLGGYCASKFALVGLTEALRTELHGEPVHVALVMPGVVETPMADAMSADPEFLELWPSSLNMPPSWVVWAVFAAARFHLVEVSVPPGAAALEKLAALTPGVADNVVHWAKQLSRWLAAGSRG
jgi:NAD(P)-dependent dehydrogenase (short-subunit alcohol dehydrogenase family)